MNNSAFTDIVVAQSAGPRYVTAMAVNCTTATMAIISATVLRLLLGRLNKKLDRGEPIKGVIAVGEAIPGLAAERGFRFVL